VASSKIISATRSVITAGESIASIGGRTKIFNSTLIGFPRKKWARSLLQSNVEFLERRKRDYPLN